MKEIKNEVKYTKTEIQYEAIDGTVFEDREECQKYEKTARCIANEKFNKLVIKTTNEWELFGGSDDNTVLIVKPTLVSDADIILQAFYMDNQHLLKEDQDGRYKEYRKKYTDIVQRAISEGDVILMGRNYEDILYFYNTRQYYIDMFNNLEKEKND